MSPTVQLPGSQPLADPVGCTLGPSYLLSTPTICQGAGAAAAAPCYNLGMSTEAPLLLALDLTGTFAVRPQRRADRAARDPAGHRRRDHARHDHRARRRDHPRRAAGRLPPATFRDWRYLAVAAGGGLIAFVFGRRLDRLTRPINVLDAAG